MALAAPYRQLPGRNSAARRHGDMDEITIATELRPLFTTDTLAAYLRVSDRMIRKWVAEGRLRSVKLDGCRRFEPADVDEFLAAMRDRTPVVA
jgi:excisionase family DNA binding protein